MTWETLERPQRQARLTAAKLAEEQLSLATDEYENYYDIEQRRSIVDALEAEAKQLDTLIKILQKMWRTKRDAFGEAKSSLHTYAIGMALEHKKLKAAIAANDEAWIGMPGSLRDYKVNREAQAMLNGSGS